MQFSTLGTVFCGPVSREDVEEEVAPVRRRPRKTATKTGKTSGKKTSSK